MNLNPVDLMKQLTIFILCLLAASPAAFAQSLTFSGGDGTPLTITLLQPVTFTITSATDAGNGNAPFFVFQGVGNLLQGISTGVTASGTMDFTINNGTPQTITSIYGGVSYGALHSDDAYIWGSLPGVAVGDVVTLNAGSLTTGSNINVTAPLDGTYSTVIMNAFSTQISSSGTAEVPEPSTWALFGFGLLGVGLVARYRRQGHALPCR